MILTPEILLSENRSGLNELQFYGYVVKYDGLNIENYGSTNNSLFFHRSCAKPLQASIIEDFKTKDFWNLSDEEIAVCCASHTGEPVHIDLIKGILSKIGLSEKDLQCPAIEPLNKEEQRKFTVYSPLHNNCSGKHTLMLAVCKQMGWDIENYLDKNHPLQIAVYDKIKNLCEMKNDMPYTPDGCTAPNWATPLENLAKGFYNVFCTDKCPDIKRAFVNNPYLIGGQDRPDTQIMLLNQKLAAKAGAGGVLCVANTEENSVLVFKITSADMKVRSIVAIETMLILGWLNKNSIDEKLLENSLNKFVKTETGEIVGEYILNDTYKHWVENISKV